MKLALSEGQEAVCLLCPDDGASFRDKDAVSLERKVREHLLMEHQRRLVSVCDDGRRRVYEGPRVGRDVFDG